MSPIPLRNNKLVDGLRNEYVTLYSPTTSLGNIVSMSLGIPGLRGYWTLGSQDENGDTYDISGQGRTLTGSADPVLGQTGLIAYSDFTRASSQSYTRADEAGLDITGNLTLGCWVQFDAASTGAYVGMLTKWETDKKSYALYKSDGDVIYAAVSTDCTTTFSIGDAAANYATGKWFFVLGRFIPSTELALFVNGTWYSNTTSVPASICDSAAAFNVGNLNGSYLDGRMCHAFLSAFALSDTYIEAYYAHTKALFMRRY